MGGGAAVATSMETSAPSLEGADSSASWSTMGSLQDELGEAEVARQVQVGVEEEMQNAENAEGEEVGEEAGFQSEVNPSPETMAPKEPVKASWANVQRRGRLLSWQLRVALLVVYTAGLVYLVPELHNKWLDFSKGFNRQRLETGDVVAPPFDKAVDVTVQWAGVLSEVFKNDTIPSPMTLARQRVLLEEASINVRTLTFADSDLLADSLDTSATAAQQASDDLVDLYVSAQSGVQLVVSYMVILDRRLSDNRTAGNATWLAAEFESFVKGTDDSLVESIEKADRAWASLAEFHQQLSLTSRVGKKLHAPLKRDLTILKKEQENSWWRWEKTSDLFLDDETTALESILNDLSSSRQDIGEIRVLLRGHREHLHNIRNAFFYSARESVPIQNQIATLKWGLGAIQESQATITDNKRRKLARG